MRIVLILFSTLLASCSYLTTPVLSPYKMEIRQGNYVTAEMREKLKLGMSKQQVRYVLGTPLISDVFHGNRWDYSYRLTQQGKVVDKQLLTLYFEGNNLARIDDGKVAESAPISDKPAALTVPVPPMLPKQDVPKPAAQVDPEADVLKSVQKWATAWSAKNAGDYLAAYAADFKPEGMSRDVWQKQRLDRISKPKVIEVTLSDINVSVADDSRATVSFTQSYRSDGYRDQLEKKTLTLVKQSGAWLIVEESFSKAVKVKAEAQIYVPATVSAQPVGLQAVQDAVNQWAEAWSARDADRYLASYSPSFKPKEMNKAAWEMQRKQRIASAHSIEVKVGGLKVKLHDDNHASATFIQGYRSDVHEDINRKTLLLEKVGETWLIAAEQVAK